MFKGKVAEELIGDLNNDTSALKGKKFDVVIDNPTTLPGVGAQRRASISRATSSTTSSSRRRRRTAIRASSASTRTVRRRRCRRISIRTRSIRSAHRAILRRAQDARRAGSAEAVSGHQDGHSSVPDRRSARSHRSLHLLAGAHRQGRRSARAGQAGRSVPVHRLARSRRVDGAHGRSARVRIVQRDRTGEADDDRRDALRREGDHDGRRAVHLGAVGVPADEQEFVRGAT